MTQRLSQKHKNQSGFTLIELAIVLGILGVLVTGLFQLTTASNRQIQDQVTAQQIQQYVKATRAYISANLDAAGNLGALTTAVGGSYNISTSVRTYRGGSLATVSPQGYGYDVIVLRQANITVAGIPYPVFMIGVFLTGGSSTTRVSMGNIASLVGAEGAGVYPAGVGTCSGGATILSAFGSSCLAIGTFNAAPAAYTPTTERPAAISYISALELGSSSSQWLSRSLVAGAPQLSTMSADLYMGAAAAASAFDASPGNDIVMTDNTNDIELAGGTIVNRLGGINTVNISSPVAMGTNAINSVGDITSTGTVTAPSVFTPDIENVTSILFDFGGGVLHALTAGMVAGVPTLTLASNLTVNAELRANSFIYTSSDRNLKQDITPLAKPLDNLLQIQGVHYVMKDSKAPSVGVLAQDVEKVYPELVTSAADGHKMVNYNGLAGPIIESLRQLENENAALRKRLDLLENHKVKAQ